MNRLTSAFLACAILTASAGAASAATAPRYEGAIIHGSSLNNAGFFKVNVQTGQTNFIWAGGNQFGVLVDNPPLPAGEYHLFAEDTIGLDSKVYWGLYRLDALTGRTWTVSGGGNAPLVWVEIQAAK